MTLDRRQRELASRELRYGRADRRAEPMKGTLTLAECAELDRLRGPVERCVYCDKPIVDGLSLFEGACGPCSREIACDDPSQLGPDA